MKDPSRQTIDWMRMGTALSSLLPRSLPSSTPRRLARLAFEGALSSVVSLLLASAAGAQQAAVVSVFFTATGLVHRFDGLLEENRDAIWGGRARGANLKTAVSLLAVFFGVFAAYAAATLLAPEAQLDATLEVIGQAGQIGGDTIVTRRFGTFLGLFLHNAGVVLTFCLVSALYRTLGALLALSWNAGIWALTLVVLVRRAASVVAMSKAVFLPIAWLAVLPHLLLEAAAYVTASIASIFLSRGVVLYPLNDPRLRAVAMAVARMMAISVALLALAALSESTVPQGVFARLRG